MGLRPANWQLPRTTYSLVDTLVAMIYDKHVTACSCKAGQLTYRYLRNHWVRLQAEMPDGEAGTYVQRIKNQINDPEVKHIYQEGGIYHAGRENGRAEREGPKGTSGMGASDTRTDGRVVQEAEGVTV